MSFPIEKNVPIPDINKARQYPFDEMEVGDSFALPREDARKVSNAAGHYKRQNPDKDFTTRTLLDVARVWRIK